MLIHKTRENALTTEASLSLTSLEVHAECLENRCLEIIKPNL